MKKTVNFSPKFTADFTILWKQKSLWWVPIIETEFLSCVDYCFFAR